MSLIACPGCGHRISSLARFCPKCNHSKSTIEQSAIPADVRIPLGKTQPENVPFPHVPFQCALFCEDDLLQSEFKPSLDEKVVLEGNCFVVRGIFRSTNAYAYLTSKRYVVCDASGNNVLFQLGCNGIASVAEGRHIISKKIIITAASGDVIKVKGIPHHKWFQALLEHKSFAGPATGTILKQPEQAKGGLDWYYTAAGVNIGPVSEKAMVQLIKNNHTISRKTRVWNSSLTEWKPAEETILTIYFGDSSRPAPDESARKSFFSRLILLCTKYL